MVTSAKSAVPTVADQAAAMQLGQCAKNLATCLAELRTATQKVLVSHWKIVNPFTSSSGCVMHRWAYVTSVFFSRPMKPAVPWRLTQPSKLYRHWRASSKTPRCLLLTANSNLFPGKRSVLTHIQSVKFTWKIILYKQKTSRWDHNYATWRCVCVFCCLHSWRNALRI